MPIFIKKLGLLNWYFNGVIPNPRAHNRASLGLQRGGKFALPYEQDRMQERLGALAVCMRLPAQSRQVTPKLVVHALNVVRMGFALRVPHAGQNGAVRLVLVGAVLNVLCICQLLANYPGRGRTPVSQCPSHDPVGASLYPPPQPDRFFVEPT